MLLGKLVNIEQKTLPSFYAVKISSEGRDYEVEIPDGHYEYAFYVLNRHLAKINEIAEFLEIPLNDYVKMCFENTEFFNLMAENNMPVQNKILDFENDFLSRQNKNEITRLKAEQEQMLAENEKKAEQIVESEKKDKVRSLGGKKQILKGLDAGSIVESAQRNAYEQVLLRGRLNLLKSFRLIFRGAGG